MQTAELVRPAQRMITLRPRYPGDLIVTMLRDPLALLGRAGGTGGDVVRARLGTRDLYVLCTPDLARALLSCTDHHLVKERALRLSRVMLGNGLLTSEGEPHRRQRRLILPAFDQRRIAEYAVTSASTAEDWSRGLMDGATVEMHGEMARLTLRIATRALLRAEIDDTAGFLHAVDTATRAFHRHRNPLAEVFDRLPLPGTIRLRTARRRIDSAIAGLVAVSRRNGGSDLLHRVEEAGDSAQVRDELVTMLLAGHETTAVALTWTWHLLASHPAAESRLHAELDRVLGPNPPTPDDLPRLSYTRQVLSESMRLFPPVWAVSREAAADVTIGDHVFHRGAIIMMSQYMLHRHPRYWSAPDRFDPDRFSAPDGIRPFTYLPFSSGIRGCIGERLAWVEAVLVLAAVARRWRVESASAAPVGLRPGISLRPDRPMPFRLRRRTTP
jgi:cytochrome P450